MAARDRCRVFALVATFSLVGCGASSPAQSPSSQLSSPPQPAAPPFKPLPPLAVQPDPDGSFARDNRAEAVLGRISETAGTLRLRLNEARVERDVVKVTCINDKL